MERGVVVGGLMICGSFLLAALLNRSAMEEVAVSPQDAPASRPVVPAAVAADPFSLPAVGPRTSSGCTEPGAADPSGATDRGDAAAGGLDDDSVNSMHDLPVDPIDDLTVNPIHDLPVNVNPACAH